MCFINLWAKYDCFISNLGTNIFILGRITITFEKYIRVMWQRRHGGEGAILPVFIPLWLFLFENYVRASIMQRYLYNDMDIIGYYRNFEAI